MYRRILMPDDSKWASQIEAALASLPVLHRVETISVADVWGEKFHSTPSHELIHVLQGRATIEFQRKSISVGPGDSFIISQGTQHRDVRGEGSDYRVLYIFFSWPTGERLIEQMNPFAALNAPEGVKPHLHLMMKELEHEYLSDRPGASERMRVILLEILLALLRYCRSEKSSAPTPARQKLARERRQKLAAGVRAWLQEHSHEAVSLEALAQHFGVSPFHLSRQFSQEYGMALVEMLTMLRVDRAAELLRARMLSIKEIAAAVGFSDANYFAKVFRRAKGISPSEFQARLKKTTS